jgi:hypothetical protein
MPPKGGSTLVIIGKTDDRSPIVKNVGECCMGVVNRPHDEQLDRDFAIRVLPVGTLADRAACKQFREEPWPTSS